MKIPPVIQFLFSALLAWLFARYVALIPMTIPIFVPLMIGLIGTGFLIIALLHFRAHKTTVNPMEPMKASALVMDGVYRVTRNPMYVGLLLLLLAWCFWLRDLSGLIAVPVFVFAMTNLQIKPEEQALTELFGDTYLQYQRRVNRWLLF